MDHILQLHVEHHSSSSLKHCGPEPGVARFGKSAGASRAVLAFAAIVALLGLLLLPSLSSVVTARTALFVLSNAILLLLAADCRWFFSISAAGAPASDAVVLDACSELPAGAVMEKHDGRRHHQVQEVQSCVPHSADSLLEHENIGGTTSEAFTETAIESDTDNTATLEAPGEQEDAPAASRPELLGLDELGIDELNKKFDDFIQTRRNRWIEEALLAV
ncbi:unnamed protein product [Urochloa decumbens]|uniref:Uncharacterized protein n=1 Tax=Urochloa decumbens TaxID=240449 RepID=A0ABC8YEN6_9POAL